MAKFVVLIYGDEQAWEAMSPAEERLLAEGHSAFQEAAGVRIIGGHELERTRHSVTLRAESNGRVGRNPGPLLNSAQALGGFYLLEVQDIEEAISLCALLAETRAGHSGVEVRSVLVP